ncbi:MAG TPA: hypothetical protein VHI10_13860 [Mycobacterium sp.]|nr:hypothetical protein [Mycobacterium sp.]
MAIGVIWYPPVDKQTYDTIREKVWQAGQDKGMKFHAAGEANGVWNIIELWESRDGFERFMREDLSRAFNELGGGQGETPQPESVFDVYYQGP